MNIYDDKKFFESYSRMGRSTDGLEGAGEWHILKDMIPDLTGKSVLDLGCGYGWHSKYCAINGAYRVTAIDGSVKMIEKALEINSDEKISYSVKKISEYDFPENEFDFVISNLVLHYIEDLDEIYRKVYRCLKKGGSFILNIEHPVFTSGVRQEWVRDNNDNILYWPVDDYFIEGERTAEFLGHDVTKYHHTLTSIINGLIDSGFMITQFKEPYPSEKMKDMPWYKDEFRRPMMLIIKAEK